MREILFRGKTEKCEWVQGCLLYDSEQNEGYIAESFEDRAAYIREIIPETIGQYTGLTDKNGKKIFEGDIVTQPVRETRKHSPCVVEFRDGKFQSHYISKKRFYDRYYDINSYTKVIGNTHDNPELLEGSVEDEK